MNLEELRKFKPSIDALVAKYHVGQIRVIVSVARGDSEINSDIDFLIKPMPEADLLDISGLNGELQNLLGKKVDFVTEAGAQKLKYMRDIIFSEAVAL